VVCGFSLRVNVVVLGFVTGTLDALFTCYVGIVVWLDSLLTFTFWVCTVYVCVLHCLRLLRPGRFVIIDLVLDGCCVTFVYLTFGCLTVALLVSRWRLHVG